MYRLKVLEIIRNTEYEYYRHSHGLQVYEIRTVSLAQPPKFEGLYLSKHLPK